MLAAPILLGVPAASAEPNAAHDTCPYEVSTPPAVDSSEVPQAGEPPLPLSVPTSPIDGHGVYQ
jgi:D-alanyl-D-alanine carboxypeptidase (penicillin-binding protein 5/6)